MQTLLLPVYSEVRFGLQCYASIAWKGLGKDREGVD